MKPGAAQRIDHHIRAAAGGVAPQDAEPGVAGVEHLLGAVGEGDMLLAAACRGQNAGTQRTGHAQAREPCAARGGVYQDGLSGL